MEVKEKSILKTEKGITLIALVVTIVVLLILAGVSIGMLGGENGIITQAIEAKEETRAGEVEEKVNLWKSEKISSKYTNATVKTEDELLEEMKTDKILFEEEIDRDNKLITIGTREISYKIDENGETGDIPLEPDTGKEELILEYTVGAGDTIELPYNLTYYDINNEEKTATFNFQVDWGDGTIVTEVNNSNIETEEKSKHQYTNAGTYEVTIKGIYEALSNDDLTNYTYRLGYDKLTKVKQWGTTGLKEIYLEDSTNLIEITNPTENSFVNIQRFDRTFYGCTSLTSIPENLFANCTNVTSFGETFRGCTNLTSIPESLFANCPNVQSFESTFERCTSLTSIPENLFANCPNVQSFSNTFVFCTELTGNAPELWLNGTNSEENNYRGTPNGVDCFYNCTKLNNYEQIPYYWRRGPI